ncbi:MAG: DNA-processing protein DprA [Huintestinicola sp.]
MPENNYRNTLFKLWTVIAFGPGNRAANEIAADFSSAEEMYGVLTDKLSQYRSKLSAEIIRRIDSASLDAAKQVMEYCNKNNINIVTEDDEDYPQRLASIYAPPMLLFYRGDISGIDSSMTMGIVGTRRPSDYTIKVTKALTRTLAKEGIRIVSGFAVGTDITAHLTAAESGGKTYAVLGSGIDYDYPAENAKYRRLIEENGALISEYLPQYRPTTHSFPQRNRILSGLSLGVAVMEAGEKSGSLNTASQALSQGRDIFAVPPHDLFDLRYAGNVRMLRDGAIPLFGARDILGEYRDNFPKYTVTSPETESLSAYPAAADTSKTKSTGKKTHKHAVPADNTGIAEAEPAAPDLSGLTGDELLTAKTILGLGRAMRPDEIANVSGLDIDDVLMALTGLEISGTVSLTNGSYSINL